MPKIGTGIERGEDPKTETQAVRPQILTSPVRSQEHIESCTFPMRTLQNEQKRSNNTEMSKSWGRRDEKSTTWKRNRRKREVDEEDDTEYDEHHKTGWIEMKTLPTEKRCRPSRSSEVKTTGFWIDEMWRHVRTGWSIMSRVVRWWTGKITNVLRVVVGRYKVIWKPWRTPRLTDRMS
jgi:hypothetical protein